MIDYDAEQIGEPDPTGIDQPATGGILVAPDHLRLHVDHPSIGARSTSTPSPSNVRTPDSARLRSTTIRLHRGRCSGTTSPTASPTPSAKPDRREQLSGSFRKPMDMFEGVRDGSGRRRAGSGNRGVLLAYALLDSVVDNTPTSSSGSAAGREIDKTRQPGKKIITKIAAPARDQLYSKIGPPRPTQSSSSKTRKRDHQRKRGPVPEGPRGPGHTRAKRRNLPR